ncbi:phage tail tape measure protein [Escherichia coli]|nr:phage tail tape measure protein [Escherichia coli]ELM5369964.1 phage tail tape measure protein [Escherichia coli]
MSDNNLRLQVILNAVDKLTRPFRAAQASSKELAGAIQNTRNSLKELNKQAGRIDEFRKTRSQLAITANNLNAAREEAAKLATQFAATNRPTAAQAKLFSQAKTRVQELQQTYNGLLGAVQRQRQALKESGIDTRQLSSAQRELKKNAEETRQALEGQQKALKRLGEQQARMNAAREQYSRQLEVRDRIAGAGATTTAAGLAMGAPVMAAVKSYTSMEDAMKGVAKQVNGLRDDNGNRTARFYEMQDAIKAASEQLPMENGAVDFAALVEGGARMNVANPDDSWEDQKRDLLAFASIWKYWQPITAFLGGVVEGFKAAAGPISAAFEPLKPVFQWIGDKVQALWGWFTDLLTPVKSTSAELQSAAAMGRRFGEALAEGLNMVMHPLDSLKSGVSWLLDKLGIVSKEAAKAKLPESVTRQQPATVNADGKVMMPSGGFPSWGYGFAGMYDSGGYIPRGQFGIVGENGPEIVNGPANVTSRRNTAALAAVVAGMMGVAAAPAELPPLHPLALPAKGGEAMVSRAATVPPVQRLEAPTQIIIQTQPGQSAQDIAREVARQLDERERRLKAKARSNYSDQGGYEA